jgi:polyferredoxin
VRLLRTLFQVLFLGGTIALLVRGLLGLTANTCETYCPFAGLIALYPLAKYKTYACAITEFNVALLVSVLGLTLLSKKSFCSWICPFGTVQEWVGKGGKKLFRRSFHLPRRADLTLMPLRYVVLGAVVVLTYTVWQFDLGFRAYDPFYILFTGARGHGTAAWSIYVLVGVLGVALLVPFFWCRYLCPLGALMDPLSRYGALRIRRRGTDCASCASCEGVCPHRIPVSGVAEVTARNCTNCLECVVECSEKGKGALELAWYGKGEPVDLSVDRSD